LALASGSDGRVLELACGTGRIAIPLAAAGHAVTGVDNDPDMLARVATAWSKAPERNGPGSLHLVEADMTTLRIQQRFDLVILGFNSFLLAADRAQQRHTLATMRDHLSKDGRAVVDVWLPSREDLEEYDGHEIADWTRVDPETGVKVEKRTRAHHDARANRARVETRFKITDAVRPERTLTRVDEIQFTSADELRSMLDEAELQPQQVARDYSMTDFAADANRIIVVAARAPGTGLTRPNRVSLL
jgi:SAM-dependent methyltransferase